jgi:hypothetical protein
VVRQAIVRASQSNNSLVGSPLKQSAKSGRDLRELIELSGNITRAAPKLNKASGKSLSKAYLW